MGKPAVQLLGQTFGRLTVVERAESQGNNSLWLCRCSCGGSTKAAANDLRRGCTASCGCLRREKPKTHGRNRTMVYKIWTGMKQRCTNPRNQKYPDYGGRGISVCQRWMDSFESFLEDMGEMPSESHSIERIENSGNYEPGNCKWATALEQAGNKRNNRAITFDGQTKTIAGWSRALGIPPGTIQSRLAKGWPPERVLSL